MGGLGRSAASPWTTASALAAGDGLHHLPPSAQRGECDHYRQLRRVNQLIEVCAESVWNPARGSYLFPVRALSRYYKDTMVRIPQRQASAGTRHWLALGEINHVLDEPRD